MRLADVDFTRISKALADPQRCEILQRAAAEGELSCAALAAHSPVCQATLSHHLKELATAGLLARRREGQFAFYTYQPEAMAAYVAELARRMGVAGHGGAVPARGRGR
jgi:DNA-binding transcriptional ArsR family regulator